MTEPKYRNEIKYLITQGQFYQIKQRLSCFLQADTHVTEKGSYNIRSLYFDDYYNSCYYENLSGTDPREKFRIRIYNNDGSHISLECKRKEHGKTLKKSCLISAEQCESIIRGDALSDDPAYPPVMRKFLNEIRIRHLHPVIIVDYERHPYIYSAGNVRITLDSNISSSEYTSEFLSKNIPKRPIMPIGMQILEVKYDEFLPEFIHNVLQLENLHHTSYSKYFLCRRYAV